MIDNDGLLMVNDMINYMVDMVDGVSLMKILLITTNLDYY